jgi:hypothetical protein
MASNISFKTLALLALALALCVQGTLGKITLSCGKQSRIRAIYVFFLFFFFFFSIFSHFVVGYVVAGGITCENLDQDTCAFAVASTGKRCVLEKHVKRCGEEAYTCRTSEIVADKLKDLVETDQCIKACGLDRKTLGISSDSLLESSFTQKLCSPQCYQSCPNIVDLYFNLAAGEGKHRSSSSSLLLLLFCFFLII